MCNVCVPFVSSGWLSGVDRDPEQPAQLGNTQCSLYAGDLLRWGYKAVMVPWVVCGLFGKLQKFLNERGADLPFYRTRLWLHSCRRYSSIREKGDWTHQKIASKKLHSLKKGELLTSPCCQVLGQRANTSIYTDMHVCPQGLRMRLQSSRSELCVRKSWHSAETHKGNIKNVLKLHERMLSQTSAAGPKCRELQALNNVHHKPVWGTTLFTLLSWVTALRHHFMVVWNLPCH